MSEAGSGEVPLWQSAAAFVVLVAVIGVAGFLVDFYRLPWWWGVLALVLAFGSLGWAMARDKGKARASESQAASNTVERASRLWSWRNYPFLIAFAGLMIAQDLLRPRFGFAGALLITVLGMAPLCVWAYVRRRRERP